MRCNKYETDVSDLKKKRNKNNYYYKQMSKDNKAYLTTCLDTVYLRRKSLPKPVLHSGTTFLLKVLPSNVWGLPSI